MSNKRIIFEMPDGSIAITVPASPLRKDETEAEYLDRIAVKARPNGATQVGIIDKDELPHADPADTTVIENYVLDEATETVSKQPAADRIRAFRNSWRWNGTGIEVDSTLETAERWVRVRKIRNKLLALSDGNMARENEQGGPNQNAYKSYRQALRVVPQDNADPRNIAWPQKP